MLVKPILPKIPKPGDIVTHKQAQFIADEIKKTFEEGVETWRPENKPTFHTKVEVRKSYVRIKVFTPGDSLPYAYVVRGTPEHSIEPKPDNPLGLLIFREKYKAKTSPTSRKSRQGGSSGRLVFSTHVSHPGLKPRPFPKQVKECWQKKFPPMMRAAISAYKKVLGA